ncbi:MAG: cation:proton antiporter [Flavobacteriaceae bacterium]|nr:cation:proton antiporter [Flavobacteriaceae bacterium]
MFLFSKLDPTVGFISILAVLAILIGLLLKKINQPYIIGYFIVGAILGEYGFGLIKDPESIKHLGNILDFCGG